MKIFQNGEQNSHFSQMFSVFRVIPMMEWYITPGKLIVKDILFISFKEERSTLSHYQLLSCCGEPITWPSSLTAGRKRYARNGSMTESDACVFGSLGLRQSRQELSSAKKSVTC